MAHKKIFKEIIASHADVGQDLQDEFYEYYQYMVDKGQELMRIDKYLVNQMADVSRNRIQNAIDAACIKVNGAFIKANYKIKPGDEIRVILPKSFEVRTLHPEKIPLDILYEDEELLVMNKQHNIVMHPGFGNYTGTLVHGLMYHFKNLPKQSEQDTRPGLVHRIDKDTTGVIVVAKTDYAHAFLSKQFYDHSIDRNYLALIWGTPSSPKGTIEKYIGRDIRFRKKMAVFPDGEHGKHAITHYEVLESFGYVSYIKCTLETGRTHQIRVHLSSEGHPIFSDEKYGGSKIVKGTIYTKYKQFVENCFQLFPRYALHATRLAFTHPRTLERMNFEIEPPDDFKALLEKWRNYSTQLKEMNN